MVALELTKQSIPYKHQVKINRYHVDFVLYDEKIVIEIDGPAYHRPDTKDAEKFRDNIIILALGPEWEIVRIPTERINQNVKRVYKAVVAVRNQRKKIRAMYNGQLPGFQTNNAV